MLDIRDHRLVGDDVTFHLTPNVGGPLQARYLVLHYTAGRSLESSVESLCTRKPQGNASAHVVIGRDGRIVQLAPFDVVTWHAGVSQWEGLTGLNQYAIGIEMDNAGLLHVEGERYVAWFGQVYPPEQVRLAEHRHGGGVQPWHTYTEAQIARALELSELLVAHYGLSDVLGHEDIAPGRKTDPGPAFPLASVKSRALGREADQPQRWRVTVASLNIRSGPGANFDKVVPALARGAELQMLEARDRWSRVAVVGATDVEGWVSNDFIERLAMPVAAPAGARARARAAAAAPAPTPRTQRISPAPRGRGAATGSAERGAKPRRAARAAGARR